MGVAADRPALQIDRVFPMATLKEHTRAAAEGFAAVMQAKPEEFNGPGRYQLTAEEESVFGINRRRWPLMVAVCLAYECLSDELSPAPPPEFDMRGLWRERLKHRWRLFWYPEQTAFVKLAGELGSLTEREAVALYRKMACWDDRNGGYVYSDEPEIDTTVAVDFPKSRLEA